MSLIAVAGEKVRVIATYAPNVAQQEKPAQNADIQCVLSIHSM